MTQLSFVPDVDVCTACGRRMAPHVLRRHNGSAACRLRVELNRLEREGYARVASSGSNSPFLRGCGVEVIYAPTGTVYHRTSPFKKPPELESGEVIVKRSVWKRDRGNVLYSFAILSSQPWAPAWAVHACRVLMEAGYSPDRRRELLSGVRSALQDVVETERIILKLR